MVMAVVLILIAVGSVLFHLWSPWWFTPLASNWGALDDAIIITFWITGVATSSSSCLWPTAFGSIATGKIAAPITSLRTASWNGG